MATLIAHSKTLTAVAHGVAQAVASVAQSTSGSAFLLAYSDVRGTQNGSIGGDVRVLDAETSPYVNYKAAFNGIVQCMARVSNATALGAFLSKIRHDYYDTSTLGMIGKQPKQIDFYVSSYTGSDANTALSSAWALIQGFTGTQTAGVYSQTFVFDNPPYVTNGMWIKVIMYNNFVGNNQVCTNGIYVTGVGA